MPLFSEFKCQQWRSDGAAVRWGFFCLFFFRRRIYEMYLKFKPTLCKKKLQVVGLGRQGEMFTSRRLFLLHTGQAATLSSRYSTGELHLRQTGGDLTEHRHINALIAFSYSSQCNFALHLEMHSKYQQHGTVGVPIKYEKTGISFLVIFTSVSGLGKANKWTNKTNLFILSKLFFILFIYYFFFFTKSSLLNCCLNAASNTRLRTWIKCWISPAISVATQRN